MQNKKSKTKIAKTKIAKTKIAKDVGIEVIDHHLSANTSQSELLDLINKLKVSEKKF